MASTQHTENEHFDCPRLNAKAIIAHLYRGEGPARVWLKAQCSCQNRCGIADVRGALVFYDWTKCPHPKLHREPA